MFFVFLGEEWWVGLETILPSAKKEVPRKVVGEGRSVHTIQETDGCGRHTFVGVELGDHEDGELWCYVWCLT